MPDNPTSPEHAILSRQLRRLRRLTVASLCVNGFVLFLILLGAVIHHHRMKHHEHSGGGWGREEAQQGWQGGYHHHHHFMDRGDWDNSRGDDRMGGSDEDHEPGRHGFHDQGGPDFGHHGFGGNREGFAKGGPDAHHGMGMGMMGGNGTPPDPATMTDGIVAHLTQALTLSDDQKAKIKPIVAAQVAEFQKNAEDRKAAMEKQFADAKAKIKPILNADQQKQLDAMPMPGQKPGDGADKASAPDHNP